MSVSEKKPTKKRLTFEFPEQIAEDIAQLARNQGASKAEILRRAIALYAFLEGERDNGGTPEVTYLDGTKTRILIA